MPMLFADEYRTLWNLRKSALERESNSRISYFGN